MRLLVLKTSVIDTAGAGWCAGPKGCAHRANKLTYDGFQIIQHPGDVIERDCVEVNCATCGDSLAFEEAM